MLIAALLLSAAAQAAPIDDSDLSRPAPAGALRLAAEAARVGDRRVFALSAPGGIKLMQAGAPRVSGRAVILDEAGSPVPARGASVRLEDGAQTPVGADGRFSLAANGLTGKAKLRLSLDNPRWRFETNDGGHYEWQADVDLGPGGAELGDVAPFNGTENAKLGTLHLNYLRAVDFLERAADAKWWDKQLLVRIPGEADYFEPWNFALELTNAEAWDVDLHELGHAVMNGAMRTAPAGGQHYIDRCYSPELAWSEGWATFFAAAVRLDRGDPDARMGTHMVPRRAPIRIENVPDDVCKGEGSEWRVSAALWDLYDTHADGADAVGLDFRALWQGIRSGRTDGIASVWTLLEPRIAAGEREPARASLVYNFMLPERPAPRPLDVARLAAPDFDGAGVP